MIRTVGARTSFWALVASEKLIGVLHRRFEPIDERGGGRNTDESWHISFGAIIAGTIAAGVAAFVAKKLGALG